MNTSLILASASPRRRELLTQIGVPFQVKVVEVDESIRANEAPSDMVSRLAIDKASAVHALYAAENTVILAADTIIEFEGRALGKPTGQDDAVSTLLALSNKQHKVSTAFCLMSTQNSYVKTVTSTIQFGEITRSQALRYWQTGEPKDKAGCYAIQGRGAVFVKHLEGSYSAVVGLPLYECKQALLQFGVME